MGTHLKTKIKMMLKLIPIAICNMNSLVMLNCYVRWQFCIMEEEAFFQHG